MRNTALLAVCGLLVGHALVFDFVNDDAFISFRYADNLVRHGELVFNVGERVEGYTNFLWTLLMAGVMALGADPVPWSKWLGIAFAVGTLLVIARFTGRYTEERSTWDAVGPLLLAGAPAYACWSTGGLETSQFTFFATLGWTAYLTERAEGRRWPLSGVFFALSAMARPEGMLLFGLTGLHRLLELIASREWPERQDWVWGFGFALVFVPFFAWRWVYYGWPFPNTYYVKTGAKSFWKPGMRYWWSWVADHHLWAVPALAVARPLMSGGRERRMFTLLGLYVVAMSLHVIRVGGDFMALHRFLVPLMPMLAVLAALGLRGVVQALRAQGHGGASLGGAGVVVAVLLAVSAANVDRKAMEVGSEGGVDTIGWLAMFADQCAAIGKHLRETAPADASMATTAAGIIPYYSRLYTVDVLGLNDEWVAHNVPARGNRPGHTKSAPLSYLLEKHVDYMVYHPTIAERRPGQGRGQRSAWKERGYEWRTERVPGMTPAWWGYWRRTGAKSPEN